MHETATFAGETIDKITEERDWKRKSMHSSDFSLALHWGAGPIPKTIYNYVAPSQIPGNTFRPDADLSKSPQNSISMLNGRHEVEKTKFFSRERARGT